MRNVYKEAVDYLVNEIILDTHLIGKILKGNTDVAAGGRKTLQWEKSLEKLEKEAHRLKDLLTSETSERGDTEHRREPGGCLKVPGGEGECWVQTQFRL